MLSNVHVSIDGYINYLFWKVLDLEARITGNRVPGVRNGVQMKMSAFVSPIMIFSFIIRINSVLQLFIVLQLHFWTLVYEFTVCALLSIVIDTVAHRTSAFKFNDFSLVQRKGQQQQSPVYYVATYSKGTKVWLAFTFAIKCTNMQ